MAVLCEINVAEVIWELNRTFRHFFFFKQSVGAICQMANSLVNFSRFQFLSKAFSYQKPVSLEQR